MPVTPIDAAGPTRVAYATVGDLEAAAPMRRFTASSTPRLADVERYLELTAADIDSLVAARGYQLPVPETATTTLGVLCHGNILGARAMVEAGAAISAATGAEKKWETWRTELRDGILELPDMPIERARARGRRIPHATPVFHRDMEL